MLAKKEIINMLNLRKFIPLIAQIVLILLLCLSCSKKPEAKEKPEYAKSISELKRLSTRKPNWQPSQVGYKGRISIWTNRILDKQLLQNLPAQYAEGKWAEYQGSPVAYQDFGEFRNEYFYADERKDEFVKSHPTISTVYIFTFGAQTRDRKGCIVAEARLLDIGGYGTELAGQAIIEEFHYGSSGNVVFYAKSRIRGRTKVKELLTVGHKQYNYYQFYPALTDKY